LLITIIAAAVQCTSWCIIHASFLLTRLKVQICIGCWRLSVRCSSVVHPIRAQLWASFLSQWWHSCYVFDILLYVEFRIFDVNTVYHCLRQLCDVVLVLPGPRRIPAHRIVLSSASDYFSAMFTSDVLEATQNEVNMKDVDPDAMTALVKYMYDGEFQCLYL